MHWRKIRTMEEKKVYKNIQSQKELSYLGKMIKKLRRNRRFSQDFICMGLCEKSKISDIENGNTIPGKFLFETLLERMGYSADKVGLLISSSEYEICILRGVIEDQLMVNNWIQARNYLEEYKGMYQKKDVLHNQYSLIVEAVLAYYQEQNELHAMECLQKSLLIIYPEFQLRNINEYALSGADLRSVIGIMDIKYHLGTKYRSDFIMEIEKFIEIRIIDEDLLAKVYSQFAYVTAKSLLDNKEWELARSVTEKGINYLVAEGGVALLSELLLYNIQALRALGENDQALEREKERESLTFAYEYFGVKITNVLSNILFPICKEDLIITNEVIYKERMARKITPKMLETRGINATSLCKIEKGKRNPRSSTYFEIMTILGANINQYDSWVDSSEYAVHLKVKEILRKINSLNYKSLEKLIEQLEVELDMGCIKNKQFIQGNKIGIQEKQGKISAQQALNGTQELLDLSRKRALKNSLYGATRLELMLVMMIAGYNEEQRQFENALQIYKLIIEAYEGSKLSMRNKMLRLIPVYANLSNLYEILGEIPSSIETARKGAQLLVSCKSGNLLGRFMATIGMSINRMSENHNCAEEEIFIYSYYLNKLMGQTAYLNIIDEYFKTNYDKDINES